jgi:hypothetical protein
VHDDPHHQTERVDDDMTLATFDFLSCIIPAIPPRSVVLTLWLSNMPAETGDKRRISLAQRLAQPPARRTPPLALSDALPRNSSRPRPIVLRAIPAASETAATTPPSRRQRLGSSKTTTTPVVQNGAEREPSKSAGGLGRAQR